MIKNCINCGKDMSTLIRDKEPICHQCRKTLVQDRYTPTYVLPKEVPKVILRKMKKTRLLEVEEIKESIYIHGPAGCGKSHHAATIMFNHMRTVSSLNWGVFVWRNVPKLLFSIRQSFGVDGDEERIVKTCTRAKFLVLDDLGAEKTTEWVFQTLYLIINERYENNKQTIFTSNLSLQQLVEKMEDDRLASRIAGMCKIVEYEGRDRRTA